MSFEPRSIPCRDLSGRPRNSTVAVEGDEAVQTVPAGEIARYNARELSALIDALRTARNELFRTES